MTEYSSRSPYHMPLVHGPTAASGVDSHHFDIHPIHDHVYNPAHTLCSSELPDQSLDFTFKCHLDEDHFLMRAIDDLLAVAEHFIGACGHSSELEEIPRSFDLWSNDDPYPRASVIR